MPKHTLATREDERGDEWDRWAEKAAVVGLAVDRRAWSVAELIRRAVEAFDGGDGVDLPQVRRNASSENGRGAGLVATDLPRGVRSVQVEGHGAGSAQLVDATSAGATMPLDWRPKPFTKEQQAGRRKGR